jgi:hypothetical protein
MDPSMLAVTSPLHTQAFVFTSASGEIIFADRAFLRLTKQKPYREKPVRMLSGVFNLDARSAMAFIEEIATIRLVKGRDLSVKTTTGSLKPSCASGVGVYAYQSLFIGADLMLSPFGEEAGRKAPRDHADVLQTYMAQAVVESKLIGTGTFFQTYVTVHIETLQILLHRIGGPQMRETFEGIVDQEARRHGIPASMKNGYLEFGCQRLYFSAYQTLYRSALNYAVNAVGTRLVANEMKAIDGKLDSRLIKPIEFDDLLDDEGG